MTAKDKDRDEFIRKNYSLDTVSRIIAAKKKYSFPKNVHIVIDKYDYADVENVSQINMPSQYNNLLNVHNQLALSCSFDMKNSECTIAKDEAAEIIRKCGIAGFICYFDKGNLYSILPGMFSFDVEGFIGKCEVNMIVTQKLDEDKKQQVLREIFFKCISIDDSMSKCGVIKKLTEISGGKDYIEQFTLSEMKKQSNNEEKIASFLKLNEQFAKVNEWKEVSEERANSLLVELCKHITLEKFQVQNVLGEKLNKVLGLHELDYLSQISKRLVEKEGELIVYELLEGLNYSIDTILGAVNVFKTYCQKILDGETITGNSKLSGQCALLGQTLSELRGLTGIENALEDVTELDMDNDRFLQVMATFTDSLKKLDKYKIYAVEQFKQLDALMERYIEIKEVVTIEKEAIKNPKNISKNYIEQQLKKSRYRDAICDLHIRLQYELNRLFGTDNTPTYELLSDPVITQYLTEEELHDMHSLRICRNGFQHPKEKRDVKYSEQIIRGWCDIVEKLGGMDNESCCKN